MLKPMEMLEKGRKRLYKCDSFRFNICSLMLNGQVSDYTYL